jgi:hypothetical protein
MDSGSITKWSSRSTPGHPHPSHRLHWVRYFSGLFTPTALMALLSVALTLPTLSGRAHFYSPAPHVAYNQTQKRNNYNVYTTLIDFF